MHVLITRQIEQSKKFSSLLDCEGIKNSIFPLIRIKNIRIKKTDIDNIKESNCIIFTSQNSVTSLLEGLEENLDFNAKTIAAIGESTKDLLNEINIKLANITGMVQKDGKVKLYIGNIGEYYSIEKIVNNSIGFHKFLTTINYNKENTINNNLVYLEIFYYTIYIVSKKINNKKNIQNIKIRNENEDILGIFNRYKKFDKSEIDYDDLYHKLSSINDNKD